MIVAMGVGAPCLIALGLARGSFAAVAAFHAPQWIAAIYLGALGGALTFFLWAFALKHTTPTRVGISIAVNPIVASLVGAVLMREPMSVNLAVGIVAVLIGITLASRPDPVLEPDPRLEQAR
jgi:drug/metabolite transporter (DMT)-like permease